MTTTESEGAAPLRPFIFDVAEIEGHTNEEMLHDSPEADFLFGLLGRDRCDRR